MHKNYVKYTYFTKRYVPEYTTKHIFQEYIIKYFSIFFINTNGKIMLNRTLSQIAWPFYGKTPLAKWTWFFISILLCCSHRKDMIKHLLIFSWWIQCFIYPQSISTEPHIPRVDAAYIVILTQRFTLCEYCTIQRIVILA